MAVPEIIGNTYGRYTVIDTDTYAHEEDVVVRDSLDEEYRIDWFKLMRVRYSKKENHDRYPAT